MQSRRLLIELAQLNDGLCLVLCSRKLDFRNYTVNTAPINTLYCFITAVEAAAATLQSTSDNVLADDLLTARRLDATNYVTDSTQASDFAWDRDSGLRIRVGMHDIRVVPQYEDVDHSADGDNDYVLNNPNDDGDRQLFQDVVGTFCR